MATPKRDLPQLKADLQIRVEVALAKIHGRSTPMARAPHAGPPSRPAHLTRMRGLFGLILVAAFATSFGVGYAIHVLPTAMLNVSIAAVAVILDLASAIVWAKKTSPEVAARLGRSARFRGHLWLFTLAIPVANFLVAVTLRAITVGDIVDLALRQGQRVKALIILWVVSLPWTPIAGALLATGDAKDVLLFALPGLGTSLLLTAFAHRLFLSLDNGILPRTEKS